MNASKLAAGAFGILGMLLMTGIALGGASAMVVPSPHGPISSAPSTGPAICKVSAALYSSSPVASIGQTVVFTTALSVHAGTSGACPAIVGYSYGNIPAGSHAPAGASCATTTVPMLVCTVGAGGAYLVTVTVYMADGMTATASTGLMVTYAGP